MRALGALQAALGLAALVSPQRSAELAGMSRDHVTGEALFGWLFALRQICLGAGGIANASPIREVNWFLQPADLALFVHAYRTRSVPRRTARMALGAAIFAVGCLVADHRGSRRRHIPRLTANLHRGWDPPASLTTHAR
jgi:hypothetical protein